MKKTISAALLFSSLIFTGWSKAKKTELTILAAASLTDVCAELKTEYEKMNPDVKLLFSFGGSGALQAQIEAGAPADLFISASTKQMDALVQKNLMKEESVKLLLQNQVVLITGKNSSTSITSFNQLTDNQVKMIAIGDPQSVPVGQYTKKICTYLNNWEQISKKANFASDVRQVLFWVESGSCEFGIVYATDAASTDGVRILASAPEGSCPPVHYPVGIIKSSKHQKEAQAFEGFLFSDKARIIFEKSGFVTLKN